MLQPHGSLASESGNVEIIVLRSLEEIEPYRNLWSRLCRHRDADLEFFQFILSTRPEASIYVLLLRTDSGEALLVGRIETTRVERRVGYFRVRSPRLRMLELIHGGHLGDIDSKVAQAIMANLRGLLRRAEVDAIRLHYADVTSPLFAEFAKVRQFPVGRQPVQPVVHRWRHLNAIASSFGESVSRNERSNQRRREKRLLAEYSGDVRIERYTSVDSVPVLNDDAERVASRSYQRGIDVGFARTDSIRRRLELVAEQGWLRAWVLYLGGTPAAFWIGTLREGAFLSDYLAYDSELANLAPGTYLTMKVLEELQDTPSGVSLVDFGPGDAAYKARFGTSEQTTANLYLFASTWRGLCASTLQAGANFATSAAKRALARLGALDRIKRGQRRRAVKVPDVN
jgi:CelD/BcsL family acetyltransferase involved in cellulose biosynthesis